MDNLDHRADDQQPGVAIRRLLPQLRHHHRGLHDTDPGGHVPVDCEAESCAKGHDDAPAEAQRDPGEVRRRQGAPGIRDHEGVQVGRGKPYWVLGSDDYPVPYLDRALPVDTSDSPIDSRELGRALRSPVHMGPVGARGRPVKQLVPVVGSGRPGPILASGPCGRVDVHHAEDDDDAQRRPEAAVDQPDDALDDAGDVRILHDDLPQRAGGLLDCFQRRRRGDAGLHNRLGSLEVPKPAKAPGRDRSGPRNRFYSGGDR